MRIFLIDYYINKILEGHNKILSEDNFFTIYSIRLFLKKKLFFILMLSII